MMYRISEIAALVGLSRTALLYYEKKQLIKGKRLTNGYRVYSNKDLQRIRLIQQLQAGGLSLKECKASLEAKIDYVRLKKRLAALDEEILQKQKSRQLLAAMLGEGNYKSWHEDANRLAPDAHLDWLITQGFNEKEALHLKWLSKNMNEHDKYMADFMKVYEKLEYWGPGSEADTLKALSCVPFKPNKILEIGSGKGLATVVLAKNSTATITAVDNEEVALAQLNLKAKASGLSSRISTVCASMTELPFDKASYDLIWAEGCAYIMGMANALSQWQGLLEVGGILMVSDLVWLTEKPSENAKEFFTKAYPDMQSVKSRIAQMEEANYDVIDSFVLSQTAWENYYHPLQSRINELSTYLDGTNVLNDINNELKVYNDCADEYGYQVFILRKVN